MHSQASPGRHLFSPRRLSFVSALLDMGVGEEETGEGVAYQLHMYTIDMYH